MYYETMEAILADTDKTIVESNNVMPIFRCQRSNER